jgi:putative ABC transport system ATP-binding protein
MRSPKRLLRRCGERGALNAPTNLHLRRRASANMPPMPAAPPVVELRAVHKAVREGEAQRPVLLGVDLTVAAGEAVAVRGRSGSGKSTLLNLIAGIDDVDRGSVRTCGIDVVAADERQRAELRRRHLGFIFQAFHLLPTLTAGENVALPLELAGVGRGEAFARARAMLERVDLGDRFAAWPSVMSGGEQQRVAVARALAVRPKLLLCDEPTGNLDDAAAGQVSQLLDDLRRQHGCALVVVTHSADAASRCDRQCWLEGGMLREHS